MKKEDDNSPRCFLKSLAAAGNDSAAWLSVYGMWQEASDQTRNNPS